MAPPNTYLSETETSELLQQLEANHDLLRHKLDGWCVWPMLRFSVSRTIQNLPLDRGSVGFAKRELLSLAIQDVIRSLWVRRARYVIKTYGSYHVEVDSGRKKDIFFDDLLRRTGDYYKIEVINSAGFHLNREPNLVPRDLSTVALAVVGKRLARRYPVKGLEEISMQISRCLRRELGLDTFTPQSITESLSEFQWQKRLYRMVLKRTQPQYLLLAEVGDYPITAAARELGIKIIEFQHGITHRYYPANSWTRYALPYKANMPVPDHIFLFGPHWQREMAVNGFWDDELHPVGSVRLDGYRNMLRVREEDGCTIVVTTQGVDTDRLLAFFLDFLRLAETRLQLRLVFKMHPAHQTTDVRFAKAFGTNGRVEIISGGQMPPTMELVKQAHLHVSIYSACHYEALALGVPTVILPFTGAENVMHLYDAGHAFLAQTPLELLDMALNWREYHVRPEVGNEYFTPGALDNIVRELRSLEHRTA